MTSVSESSTAEGFRRQCDESDGMDADDVRGSVLEKSDEQVAGLKGLATNLSRHLLPDSMEPYSLAIDPV